jgi:hypothetical protein
MNVMRWLLDSDPSIRWQALRDLTAESDEAVALERKRVAAEGWGKALLACQGADGHFVVGETAAGALTYTPLRPGAYCHRTRARAGDLGGLG